MFKFTRILTVVTIIVAMAATTFGGDVEGYRAISGTEVEDDVRVGQNGNLGHIDILSGGHFTMTGQTLFGEAGDARLDVQVGGELFSDTEWLQPEDGYEGNTELNVYGPAFIEQLKMYGVATKSCTAVVGNGTDVAVLTVLEGLLGKADDASITINPNATMMIAGDWDGLFKIDSDALGTDSYIDLVGSGTLIVNASYTSVATEMEPGIRGNGVAGAWIKTFDAGAFDGDGANVYTVVALVPAGTLIVVQ